MNLDLPLYQPIETPEFLHCSAQQPCQERFDMMRPYLEGVRSMVDIGCHTGWFCRAFSRLGIQTLGIDRSPEWLATAIALHPEGHYIAGNVSEMEVFDGWDMDSARHSLHHADVALCLSVAMYFDGNLWPNLRKISKAAPKMFFDFGGIYAGNLPFGESDAIEAVTANTAYTEGRLLGRSAIHRPLFMFTR